MIRVCSIAGCDKSVHCRDLCTLHYQRWNRHGDPNKTVIRAAGEGTQHIDGYWAYEIDGRVVLEHVLIAERALGKRLPKGAQVHHVDGDRMNNDPSNLVVCQDAGYHQLLHVRQRALDACGHPDWLKCQICGEYGPPSEVKMYLPSRSKWHPACWKQKYGKQRKAA